MPNGKPWETFAVGQRLLWLQTFDLDR